MTPVRKSPFSGVIVINKYIYIYYYIYTYIYIYNYIYITIFDIGLQSYNPRYQPVPVIKWDDDPSRVFLVVFAGHLWVALFSKIPSHTTQPRWTQSVFVFDE